MLLRAAYGGWLEPLSDVRVIIIEIDGKLRIVVLGYARSEVKGVTVAAVRGLNTDLCRHALIARGGHGSCDGPLS